MKNILRASLTTSALVLTGLFVGATGASAQVTETVTFDGVVDSVCFMTNVVDGTLDVSADILTLASDVGTGTAGSIDLDCNANVDVSVAAPVEVTAPGTFTATTSTATVTTTAGNATNVNGTATPVTITADVGTGVVNETIDVDASFVSANLVPAGTYQFTVDVTATPQ